MACIFLLKPSIIYCSKKNKNRNLFTDFYSDKVCYFFGLDYEVQKKIKKY